MSALLDDLAELFPVTVSVESLSGHDRYGKEQYGAPVTYRAMLEDRASTVRNSNGEVVTSDVVAYLQTADAIPPDSRVTLPDGSTRDVERVWRAMDETGYVITTLYL